MGLLQCIASLSGGSGQWNPYNTLPHCLGVVGKAILALHCCTAGAAGTRTPAMHSLTTWGQWAAQLLHCTAPEGVGQWHSCNALPHCLGAVGCATPAIDCLTDLGQWAVQLPQCTSSLLGVAGSVSPAVHCLTARGQWAVQLVQYTASLPGANG